MMMLASAHSGSVVCGLSAREGDTPVSLRVVCRSGGKVDALPIVESSWRSDTHPMSNDATPTLGGFGSGPSEVSVNQRGYPTVNGVDGAGWRRPSPVAVAQWSSRRRRVVFSLLAGVRLAAGGGSCPVGLRHRRGTAFTAVGAIDRHRVGRCPDALMVLWCLMDHESDIIFLWVAGLHASSQRKGEHRHDRVVGCDRPQTHWAAGSWAGLLGPRSPGPPGPARLPTARAISVGGSRGAPRTGALTSETAVDGHPGCGKDVSSSPAALPPRVVRSASGLAAQKPVGERVQDMGLGHICVVVVAGRKAPQR